MAIRQFKLEEGETVQFAFLPALIAEALHEDKAAYDAARKEIAAELSQMVDDGTLTLRDPLTLEPLIFKRGDTPLHGVLTADDLYGLLEAKGFSLNKSKHIRVSVKHKSFSVEDVMTLVIDAAKCNDDVVDGLTGGERLAMSVMNDFMSVCDYLSIRPRVPYDPERKYTREDDQSAQFEITPEEFKRYAAHYGVVVESVGQSACSNDGEQVAAVHEENQTILRNKLTGRTHALNAEIKIAKNRALNGEDANTVWTELIKMAENKEGSFVGFSSDGLQYKGKKYQDTGAPDVLTLKAFRQRMRRAKGR